MCFVTVNIFSNGTSVIFIVFNFVMDFCKLSYTFLFTNIIPLPTTHTSSNPVPVKHLLSSHLICKSNNYRWNSCDNFCYNIFFKGLTTYLKFLQGFISESIHIIWTICLQCLIQLVVAVALLLLPY